MNQTCSICIRIRSAVAIAASLLCGVAVGYANEHDPTVPSDLITSRLQSIVPKAEVRTTTIANPESDPEVPEMRLKGMVLSTADIGTAVVAVNQSEIYQIPLRRTSVEGKPISITIAGTCFTLIDFSDSYVELQTVVGNSRIIVN